MTSVGREAVDRKANHPLGGRVIDVDEEELRYDVSYGIVVGKPPNTAETHQIADGLTVDMCNPGYSPTEAVVEIAFVSDVGQHVADWRGLDGGQLAEAIKASDCRTYTYPETRLANVTRDECNFCTRRGYCVGTTFTDDSGGVWGHSCLECYHVFRESDHPTCVICRSDDATRRKASNIVFHDPGVDATAKPYCDSCRRDVLDETEPVKVGR